MKEKIKKALKRLFYRYVSTKLPVGMSEFDLWADDLVATYDMPTTNNDTIRFILAAAIINLDNAVAKLPKHYFYSLIMAGAAKQVAGQVFQDIKTKQKEAAETAKKEAVSNEPQANSQI